MDQRELLPDLARASGLPGPGGRSWPVRTGQAPSLVDGFVARAESVPGLTAQLVPGAVLVLADGPAGKKGQPARPTSCGKTQLAVYLAESLWRARKLDLLAWVDATSRASILAGYLEAAAAAGIDIAGSAEQAAARFTGWLGEATIPWLLVLDDLRDPADLASLWPRGPAGPVLVTTHDHGIVPSGPGVQVVPVGTFSTREALGYLMGRLTTDPDQRRGAIDLARALGGDPMALAQASAVLITSMVSCTDYHDHYKARQEQLATQTPGHSLTPVALTTVISAEQAGRLEPGSTTGLLLAFGALFGGHPVPGSVFTRPAVARYLSEAGGQGAGPDRVWETVLILARVGLLTIDPTATPPWVRVSEQVAAQIRTATPEKLLDQAVLVAADALAQTWPEREPRPWLAAGLRSCTGNLLNIAADRLWATGGCHPVLLRVAHSLDSAHLTGSAADHWAYLASTSDRLFGPDDPVTLDISGNLAQALLAAGRPAKALACAQRILDGHTRRSGPCHSATLTAQITVGQALLAAEKPGHAITVLDGAVAAHERAYGADDPATFAARDHLADAYTAAGMPAEAAEVHWGTLTGREWLRGPDHRDTIAARDKLAAACLAAGHYDAAIDSYRTALASRRSVLGQDHLDTIASLANLARALQAVGDMAAALPLHEQACQDYQQVLGPDHPRTLACQAGLAGAYHGAGRLADAAVLLRDTLARCERALPPSDPLTSFLRETATSTMAAEQAPRRIR